MDAGRSRELLHLKKLDEFAAWAARRGWTRGEKKGCYEVLRLEQEGKPPLVFYARDHAKEHATAHGEGLKLVQKWMRERRKVMQGGVHADR